MFYRFMNDGNIKWRKLLYAMNLQLIRKISRGTEAGHDKPVCLIIDDTDAPKSGRKSEPDASELLSAVIDANPKFHKLYQMYKLVA